MNDILTIDRPEDDECSDFTLVGGSCWITVGALSVYIIDRDGAVSIEVLPKSREMEDNLGSLLVYESDIPEETENE